MKRILAGIFLVFLISFIIAAYLWFKPQRNIVAASPEKSISVSALAEAFIQNEDSANHVFLNSDGNSTILQVTGLVGKTGHDAKGNQYIELLTSDKKTGFTALLSNETVKAISSIRQGQDITIKGAIAAGNHYDKDLDFHEPGVLVQCVIIRK